MDEKTHRLCSDPLRQELDLTKRRTEEATTWCVFMTRRRGRNSSSGQAVPTPATGLIRSPQTGSNRQREETKNDEQEDEIRISALGMKLKLFGINKNEVCGPLIHRNCLCRFLSESPLVLSSASELELPQSRHYPNPENRTPRMRTEWRERNQGGAGQSMSSLHPPLSPPL